MKILISIFIMLVVIVLSIFPTGQNERELNRKTLTIESRLWSRPQEKMFVIDEVFVHFCRQNNCSVNISIVSDGQMLHRASIQKKTGKLTTDVVIAYAAYFSEWVANDYVLDITREIRGWQDRTFSPGINQMAVIDDRQYFALIASDVYLLCANKAALKYLSAGVDVQNLSWEQFSSWALAIARGEGVGKLAVTGVPGTAFIYQFAGIALSYGAGFPDVSSAGAIKAWELVITMKDALMPVIATCNNPVKPMLSGEAWLTWAHVANVGEIHSNAPARFIVAPVPYGPEGKGSIAGTQGIGIRKGTLNKELAIQFIEYLTRPGIMLKIAKGAGSWIPPVSEAVHMLGNTSQDKIIGKAIDVMDNGVLSFIPSEYVLGGNWLRIKHIYDDIAAAFWESGQVDIPYLREMQEKIENYK